MLSAQTIDPRIAAATALLAADLRSDATVALDTADGNRRILQSGTNGWVCQLQGVDGAVALCYEGEPRVIFVSVEQPDGQPVEDVRANEVSVEQDGEMCAVLGLEPGPHRMTVALLVDTSQGMFETLNALRDGLRNFLDTLPSHHEVGLFTLSGQTRERVGFTLDRDAVRASVGTMFQDTGMGLLLEGVIETWERRFDLTHRWPVFVTVVRDQRAWSHLTTDRVAALVDDLVAHGASLYTVFLSAGGNRTVGGGSNNSTSLELARIGGGSYRALAVHSALPTVLEELATDLATHFELAKGRYRLVYECEEGARDGELRVGVGRPGLALGVFLGRQVVP